MWVTLSATAAGETVEEYMHVMDMWPMERQSSMSEPPSPI